MCARYLKIHDGSVHDRHRTEAGIDIQNFDFGIGINIKQIRNGTGTAR